MIIRSHKMTYWMYICFPLVILDELCLSRKVLILNRSFVSRRRKYDEVSKPVQLRGRGVFDLNVLVVLPPISNSYL